MGMRLISPGFYGKLAPVDASAGPNSPGTVSQAAPGDNGWANLNNVKVSDDTYATCTISSLNSTQQLKASNFGFSIPSGATIKGILVEIERKASIGGKANVFRLMKAGSSVSATDKAASDTSWSTTEGYVSFGGSTDLWGTTWSASDINDTGFGVQYSGTVFPASANGNVFSIDHIRITVYYSN